MAKSHIREFIRSTRQKKQLKNSETQLSTLPSSLSNTALLLGSSGAGTGGVTQTYLPPPLTVTQMPQAPWSVAMQPMTQPAKPALRRTLVYHDGDDSIQMTYWTRDSVQITIKAEDHFVELSIPLAIFKDFYDEILKQHLADELSK